MSWRRWFTFSPGSLAILIPVAGALMLLNYSLFDHFVRSIGKEILFTGLRVAIAGAPNRADFDTRALRSHIAASEFVRPVRANKSYVHSIRPNEVLVQRVGFLRYHFVFTSPESARKLLVFEIFSSKALWIFHVSTGFMWVIILSFTWALRNRERKENLIRENVMKSALEAWLRQGELSSFVSEQFPQLVRWWEHRQAELDEQARALHDIKVPLAALEHASSVNAPATVQTSVRTIQSILEHTRKKAPIAESEDFDVLEELRAAAAGAQAADPRVKISVRARLERGPRLAGRGDELRRHVTNLLMNAIEASLAPVTSAVVVELAAEELPAGLRIQVRDWGKGIPAKLLERIGKRGFTFGKAKGTGLGVHYCREWVEAAGGEFSISSAEGQGTTVTLEFPWSAVILDGARAFAGMLRSVDRDAGKEMKIIVFDDDAIFRDLYRMLFTRERVPADRLLWATNESELDGLLRQDGAAGAWILSDYYFDGTKKTGPDALKERGLAHRGILVSNVEVREELRSALGGAASPPGAKRSSLSS